MSGPNTALSAPVGSATARFLKGLRHTKGNFRQLATYAEGSRDLQATPLAWLAIKAAVDAEDTVSGGSLAAARVLASDFIPLVRPRSLVDRIPGFIRVPANTLMVREITGAVAVIGSEGKPTRPSAPGYESLRLAPQRIDAWAVVTDALFDLSSPSSEIVISNSLAKAIGARSDSAFIDPAAPDSITRGATTISSSGSTLAQIDSDLRAMIAAFNGKDAALETAVFAMGSKTAAYLATLRGTGGAPAYPNIGAKGGTLIGLPVYVSDALIASGSPGEGEIVLFDPTQILMTDDDTIAVSILRHASVQMVDNPATGATALVSLWQNNLVGIAAERWMNWIAASGAVVVLSNVTF